MKFNMETVKSLNYRLCIPSLKFIELDPQTNEVTGVMGGPVRAGLSILTSSFKNVTLIKPSDSESLVIDTTKNKLPGCWGILQRGEADVYLYANEMPIIGLENITQINSSALQSGTYMLAPYSSNESFSLEGGSPLAALNTVSLDTWTNIAVMIILFSVLMLYTKLFVYKRPTSDDSSSQQRQDPREEDEALHGQSLLYQVITHIMQFETCDYSGNTIRYVSLLMSIFAFLFITFLSCMITCDKVSTHDIHVYDTYEKILENKNVQPVWVENLNDYAAYQRAPEGTSQAQLWQQSMAISKRDPKRLMFMETSVDAILQKINAARKKNFVIFLSNMFTSIILGVMCTAQATDNPAIKQFKDLRAKIRLDTHVATSLYAMPASAHSSVTRYVEYSMRRIIEARLLHQPDLKHMIRVQVAKEFLGGKINYNEDYYQCLNFEKLPPGESETSPLALIGAVDVFRWWAYGCFASFIVFLLENSCKPEYQPRSSRIRSSRCNRRAE